MSFSSFSSHSGSQPMNEINTTPLVDVMLVLLVIFLITAPLLNQAVPIDLPKAESTLVDQHSNVIQLAIDKTGTLFVDGAQTDAAELERVLKNKILTDQQSAEVHLRADRLTHYERVVQAMTAANKAGISKISFVTESPAPATTPPQENK